MQPTQDNAALFRLAGVGVVETDLYTGRFRRVNRAFCEMVGFSEAELLGTTNAELTHPDDWSRDAAVFGELARGERREASALTRVRHKDGALRWLELSVTVLGEGDAAVNLAVVSDVTKRHQAEAAVRESEARLASDLAGMRRLYRLHARLSDGIDLRAALDEILAVACKFTGTERGCVQIVSDDGARLEMFTWRGYRDDSPFVERFRYEGVKQGCDAVRVERRRLVAEDWTQVEDLDDDVRAVLRAENLRASQSTPIIARNGDTLGVLSTQFAAPHRPTDEAFKLVDLLAWTAADFVERHRRDAALRDLNETLEQRVAERTEALARSERRFSQAFNVGPVAACITTLSRHGVDDETFVEVNDEFCKLTGYQRDEAVGKSAHELGMWSSPGDQQELERVGAQAGEFHDLELHLQTKTGETKDILLSGAVISLDGHQGLLKLFYDITNRKRTELQLVQAIQEVMSDTAWFSQSVLERFTRIRGGGAIKETVELSPRERQILERLAQGKNNTAIAEELGIKAQTVRNYVATVYDKLGVHTRAEAVVWARERGLAGF